MSEIEVRFTVRDPRTMMALMADGADNNRPDGVEALAEETRMLMSADAGFFADILVSFAIGIPASVVGSWLYDVLKKAPPGTIERDGFKIDARDEDLSEEIERWLEEERANASSDDGYS